MPEFAAKLRGTTGKGRWMSDATKRSTIVLVTTVGLGTIIALWVVPWQMRQIEQSRIDATKQGQSAQDFSQTKLVDILEKSVTATERSTAATQAQTSVMNAQTGKLDDLCDSHEDLCVKLDKLIDLQTEAAK